MLTFDLSLAFSKRDLLCKSKTKTERQLVQVPWYKNQVIRNTDEMNKMKYTKIIFYISQNWLGCKQYQTLYRNTVHWYREVMSTSPQNFDNVQAMLMPYFICLFAVFLWWDFWAILAGYTWALCMSCYVLLYFL